MLVFENRPTKPQPSKDTVVHAMQKDDSKSQAGAEVDSSTKDEITSVSQHNAKPLVVGRSSSIGQSKPLSQQQLVLQKLHLDHLQPVAVALDVPPLYQDTNPDWMLYLQNVISRSSQTV